MNAADTAADALLTSAAPVIEDHGAEAIALRHFGVAGRVSRLTSERDVTFCLSAADGRKYSLKFANPAEPHALTDFQTQALLRLAAADPGLPVPRILPSLSGQNEVVLPLADGRESVVRLLSWLEGEQVARIAVGQGLRRDIGTTLARLSTALAHFEHPAAEHDLLWDIRHADRLVPLIAAVPEAEMRAALTGELDHFATGVLPLLRGLRRQVVHNDMNHYNILVEPSRPSRISGVLDFGDMVMTHLVADVAIAGSYLIAGAEDPVAAICDMLGAYHPVLPLQEAEIALLRDLVVARLATTICITEWRASRYPENAAYIRRNNGAARDGMQRFATLPRDRVTAAFRRACGMGLAE